MIRALIRWSIHNRILILLAALLLSLWGAYSIRTMPLDAIPDLSDVQVIIRTSYAGQTPQTVEDQITYPLSTAMLSVPGATAVRGYSFFGDSYVYVIFSDDTDLYWARSRVLEYLNQISGQLPPAAKAKIGPDATGVGWIYQYALVDRSGKHDLAELRSLQDWFVKYELQTLPGVSEVATVGGMIKQYQVEIDPHKLRGYYLTLANVKRAIAESNQEISGSVLEQAEAEYMLRFKGYLQNIKDIGLTSVPTLRRRISISSVLLDDIARSIHIGPAMRRGIADLDGEGEVVGGIIVMRSGANALATINEVTAKMAELQRSLPSGVELVETYNRSSLIERSVSTLQHRLLEEFCIVFLVCALFLYHFRSSLVILVSLPIGIMSAFIIMRLQGINANIMSLGGIAIAIGAMVDASIVMIENVHKHMERSPSNEQNRIQLIQNAALEVGPALFYSLLIITLSFLPVFALEGQEAKLFAPLAYTKTYAMAAASGLSITLTPALMVYFIRGKLHRETENPIARALSTFYRPMINSALLHPFRTIALVLSLLLSTYWPYSQLGSEFMPEMDEGDLLYMPTTLPAISVGKARELLQQTDRLIKTVPEVKQVFGKVGRSDSATDPAPLTMLETVIQLKPKAQWRDGMTLQKLKQQLDQRVQIPSLRNAWLMPIRARIDMQSTGINTPIGIKISGPDIESIQMLGRRVESILARLEGTKTVFSERTSGARYIDIDIDRHAAAHYGLSIAEIEEAANIAVGGVDITYTQEGRERYPVNLRYPREFRDSISKLKELPLVATEDTHVQLQDLAEIRIVNGPPVIKSENARINGWVYITTKHHDLGAYIEEAQQALNQQLEIPTGCTLSWSGQYTYMERVQQKMRYIIPITLILILTLLYLSFRNFTESFMIMLAIPLALVGGIWLLWLLDYQLSVAVGVGFIALAGIATEFGIVMLIYLREAVHNAAPQNALELRQAVIAGAAQRIRPKAMTAAVIFAGLLPILLGSGSGSEAMKRIAAPIIGGMLTAPLVSMLLIPVLFYLMHRKLLHKKNS
ncbi:CusA/CzcA family heavy metal efflux RND transporter [Methylomarinum sp. Ch1-1]|uniref:CusA/CzcA family heavy metal efflux RND transporter n=1 Tax=Methylomarinum roseum TaxID=3067653 RepID=A0AAU7NVS3_9GAMM|nr:CusA/CzcA family heavy metal efflux RND transporter [Methylomarinum sp. Ch1-1]MDP4522948.1 CusA/CzcA family heavy metal efflux RND transporter [Methylomarinum sp. Ch1-1]